VIKSKIIVGHALKNDLQVRSAALPDSLRFRSGEPPACLRLAQCAFVYVRLSARACARVFACVRFHAGACAAVCACVFLSLPACVCDMVAVRSSQRTSPTLITTAQANLRTQSMQCNHRCLCTRANARSHRPPIGDAHTYVSQSAPVCRSGLDRPDRPEMSLLAHREQWGRVFVCAHRDFGLRWIEQALLLDHPRYLLRDTAWYKPLMSGNR
jgi:hypothetical protein